MINTHKYELNLLDGLPCSIVADELYKVLKQRIGDPLDHDYLRLGRLTPEVITEHKEMVLKSAENSASGLCLTLGRQTDDREDITLHIAHSETVVFSKKTGLIASQTGTERNVKHYHWLKFYPDY